MLVNEVYNLVSFIAAGSVLIPIVIFLSKSKALNATLRALFLFLLLSLIADVTSLMLRQCEHAMNIIYNSFTILECGAILFIYLKMYERRWTKGLIVLLFLVFLIFALWSFGFRGGVNWNDENVSALEAGIVITVSGSYFLKILLDETVMVNAAKYYFFWINFAFLIYFCASFLIFKTSNFVNNCQPPLPYYLYGMHQIFNIICNILFSIGIWKMKPVSA